MVIGLPCQYITNRYGDWFNEYNKACEEYYTVPGTGMNKYIIQRYTAKQLKENRKTYIEEIFIPCVLMDNIKFAGVENGESIEIGKDSASYPQNWVEIACFYSLLGDDAETGYENANYGEGKPAWDETHPFVPLTEKSKEWIDQHMCPWNKWNKASRRKAGKFYKFNATEKSLVFIANKLKSVRSEDADTVYTTIDGDSYELDISRLKYLYSSLCYPGSESSKRISSYV